MSFAIETNQLTKRYGDVLAVELDVGLGDPPERVHRSGPPQDLLDRGIDELGIGAEGHPN